jgi:plastocyanin
MTFVHRSWRPGLVAATLLIALAAISPVLGATSKVSIADKQFTPGKITVAVGDTVTWTVDKSINEPHTVTSGTSGAADNGSVFDSQKDDPDLSKLKAVGGTFSFTFDKAGAYAYFCAIHAGMTGEVVVLAAGETPPAAEAGVPAQNKLIGAAILVITLVVLFGAAWFYRRMNPA